ncbi:MAG: hypothetical protein IJQ84_00980 [Paludibacteraceae bacterium]|nr:hypothetical protein [Paludibacteraceae bacterium]
MTIDKSQIKYPLLPYSQLVWEMTRWMPMVYRFPVVLRWKGGAKEKDRIEQAIRRALENHPVFASRVDWRGRQYAAELKDIFCGQFHGVDCYTRMDDLYIRTWGSRILGDGKSGEILLEDITRAYYGLPLEPDDYWGYVAQYERLKNSSHYRISQSWLIKEFSDESVPVRPTMDRKHLFTILPPKAGLYEDDYTLQHEKIERLKKEQFISYEGIFSLCTALAIAEYCGTDSAALTWAYEGRETEDEQRIVGSLHRDIPFKINVKSPITNHKSDLIREARNQIRSGIAHSDYPYTLTYPYTKRWNYAVNVLRAADTEDLLHGISLPITIESVPPQKYAYSLLDVEIYDGEALLINYRYSATHYKPESIRRFAALVRKYVEWLIK